MIRWNLVDVLECGQNSAEPEEETESGKKVMGVGNLGKEKNGYSEEPCCRGLYDWSSGKEMSFHWAVKGHAGHKVMVLGPGVADNLGGK